MSQLENLLNTLGQSQIERVTPELAIRTLAAHKPLRIFLQSITSMPTSQFREFVGHFQTLFRIAQNDMLTTKDSGIILELAKYPHFVALFQKLGGL